MLNRNELLCQFAASPLALWRDWAARVLSAEGFEAKIHPATESAAARKQGIIAVVPVNNLIIPKPNGWEAEGFATSTQTIGRNMRAAVADPDVKAVVLDINSPGGNVSGVPELADEIMSMRGSKPIVAQVNHLAASAAYWIAAAADEIVSSPSGEAGSIGVWALHQDYSKMLDRIGIKMTFVSAGKYKVEGNPTEPLNEEARAAMQLDVDHYYGMFLDSVARGRGVKVSAVREGYGEGRVLPAARALQEGMIDKVRTLSETLAAYGVGAKSSAKARAGAINRRRRELAFIDN